MLDINDYIDKIICGDCLKIMRDIPDESVDLVVTDPPYGLKFMGKSWDKAVPPVDVWKECLRVLKPGAFAFIMCIPRQDCLARMIVNLEDAGFKVSFTSLYWCYATGFPKAANVGKLIDKRKSEDRKITGIKHSHYPDTDHGGDNRKPSNGDGFEGFVSGLNGKSARVTDRLTITEPATPEAKALDGSYCGFQPKPAVEVVLVAMKPLSEKTYIDQAMKNGKGVTWLDDGRIPYKSADWQNVIDKEKSFGNSKRTKPPQPMGWDQKDKREQLHFIDQSGRFPANLLVSDDVLNDGYRPDGSGGGVGTGGHSISKHFGIRSYTTSRYHDSGSYSRYFSLDSWWNERAKQLPQSVQKTLPFMIVPKASKKEKGKDNDHPTVKPVKLMSYLITLGSRFDDIILDPYAGSGTTLMAAKQLGRHYIGIEISPEYCQIAEHRLAELDKQPDMFTT